MSATKPKWWQVYGDDTEKRVFVGTDGKSGLARHPSYKWRSVDALIKESGATRAEVEQVLKKFLKSGIIIQSEKGDNFGYWELVAPHSADLKKTSVEQDQDSRINKASKK